uniref:EF-hand domain-containing protein n=1 Tax=Neogobius melanostomus TaxID=47308 RepID=A0A8C6SLB7_9GOBI
MEEAEQSEYVAQLKAEFDACDSTGSGFLDEDDLTKLCGRLHLDAHLRPLLERLLPQRGTRVSFEEFKDGFVAVLSRTLDLSSSDDSSYLQPVVPDEVKPKFVKGWKRYGRRSRPDGPDCGPNSDQSRDPTEGLRGAKLRRATSLDSIEVRVRCPPVRLLVKRCINSGTSSELCWRLQSLDPDVQGRVSLRDVHRVLCPPAPLSSTPRVASTPLPGATHERSFGLPSPSSLLTVGQRLLSALDDGSGTTSPSRSCPCGERRMFFHPQMLDFSLDERLCLSDLTVALENELLVSDNSVHQAAFICYKTELQSMLEQTCRERDKAKSDLDQTDRRNLQLIRESEERQSSVESGAASRVREVEAACRGRLSALRAQMEQEMDLVLQQMEKEKSVLQEQLKELTTRESDQQGALCALRQENLSLEQELASVKLSLRESQSSVNKLHQDLDRLLLDKVGTEPTANEIHGVGPQQRRGLGLTPEHCFVVRFGKLLTYLKTKAHVGIINLSRLSAALVSLDSGVDSVSIQTELALEQLREKHQEEINQLNVKLETQVRRFKQQRERAEMEQNFAREISNLVQRLSAEKDQLEAELRLKMDQELLLVRTQMEEVRSENSALLERLTMLQQEVAALEEEVATKRRKLEETQRERGRERDQQEALHRENADLRGQILDLSRRNLDLSDANAELSAKIRADQESLEMTRERLKSVNQEQEEHSATVSPTQALHRSAQTPDMTWVWSFQVQRLKEELVQTERDKQEAADPGPEPTTAAAADSAGPVRDSQDPGPGPGQDSTRIGDARGGNYQYISSNFLSVSAQALRANTALSLVQAQHLRHIQQIQESTPRDGSRSRDELDSALNQLRDERQQRERLEQELRDRETSVNQEQYEKAVSALQQRADDLETQLKATRGLLQEKVTELGALVQQLYLENSELQGALQVMEQRHRQAQKKSQGLESKVQALNRVLRQLVPHALA